jgi:hypothetical protein
VDRLAVPERAALTIAAEGDVHMRANAHALSAPNRRDVSMADSVNLLFFIASFVYFIEWSIQGYSLQMYITKR